ncbi:HlyD family type I secretion periplasmic adaptor subunit [Epibacterium sp. Ofav1-8]|uniref:HlyD family type I secretion periplasmic adaptor subunit n=1 Tax=Epibacterium sp. Ofav1-8 TaxID=2917735 RepID=UPI001EF5FD17|nr:HlyD family type I secretion periplasmic adaptor subunit [Epibacterium sp. Ofav1-8]MCG7626093.1 HlyD family type I secretion periplasmic adaptor subunit [Epibacterium sp. Ofav1-8]
MSVVPLSTIEPRRIARRSAEPEDLRFRPGEVVFAQGAPADSVYIVLEGEVALARNKRARSNVLDTRHPDDVLGEDAFSPDGLRLVTARARTACVLRRIPTKDASGIIAEDPALHCAFLSAQGRLAGALVEDTGMGRFEWRRLWSVGQSDDATKFRPDAIEIETSKTPFWMYGLPMVILFTIMAMLAWASTNRIATVVVADGTLQPSTANFAVRAPDTSLIDSIHVKPGDRVRKGNLLAVLDDTEAKANLATTEAERATAAGLAARLELELTAITKRTAEHELVTQAAALPADQAEIFRERMAEFTAQLDAYEIQRRRMAQDEAHATNELQILQEQISALSSVEAARQKLNDRGVISDIEFLGTRNQVLSLQRQAVQLTQRMQSVQAQMTEAEASLRAFVASRRGELAASLSETRAQLDALDQQILVLRARSERIQITSTIDGIVLELTDGRADGAVVGQGEPILTIVPTDAQMMARLRVNPKDISLTSHGARVVLRLEALPFVRHGEMHGEIVTISSDVIQPQGNEQPYYDAIVRLDDVTLRDVPQNFALLPGMRVSGNIVAGDRRVISYFFDPIIKGLRSALRET